MRMCADITIFWNWAAMSLFQFSTFAKSTKSLHPTPGVPNGKCLHIRILLYTVECRVEQMDRLLLNGLKQVCLTNQMWQKIFRNRACSLRFEIFLFAPQWAWDKQVIQLQKCFYFCFCFSVQYHFRIARMGKTLFKLKTPYNFIPEYVSQQCWMPSLTFPIIFFIIFLVKFIFAFIIYFFSKFTKLLPFD